VHVSEETTVQTELTGKFPFLQDKVRVQRDRRIWAEVPYDRFAEVFQHTVKDMRFSILCTITGLDLGGTLGAIYHLARENGVILNLSTAVPKDKPVLQSITSAFPAADCYERELVDLLGFQVQGLPEGWRYPLPDVWPAGQYPLRKDWSAETNKPYAAMQEAKNEKA
jgi:membrane-bound hydrogenase subunit beta